jgi:hypothetical protein
MDNAFVIVFGAILKKKTKKMIGLIFIHPARELNPPYAQFGASSMAQHSRKEFKK